MKKIERKNITQFVYYGEIVFDGVTDDFYVTCKFNKIMALYVEHAIRLYNLAQENLSTVNTVHVENT